MRTALALLALAAVPAALDAQGAAPGATMPRLSVPQQLAAAVLPLPVALRDGATVLGYADGATTLSTLRKGTGDMVCLAPAPGMPRFHVACYHQSMEPFMARGRSLRAAGVTARTALDSTRFAEAKAGKIALPSHPAALYSLTGNVDTYDVATNAARGAQTLFVVYVPNATSASTGLSRQPSKTPWLMDAGTPKAHIMFTPDM